MWNESWQVLDPKRLSRLLDIDEMPSWEGKDLAAALRHQLGIPVLSNLAQMPLVGTEFIRLKAILEGNSDVRTFLDHLTTKHPNIDVLEAIKVFSRQLRDDAESPLGGAPATVLYFAAIAAALRGCRTRITSSTDDTLREGFAWAQQVEGAEQLRELFCATLKSLQAGSAG